MLNALKASNLKFKVSSSSSLILRYRDLSEFFVLGPYSTEQSLAPTLAFRGVPSRSLVRLLSLFQNLFNLGLRYGQMVLIFFQPLVVVLFDFW